MISRALRINEPYFGCFRRDNRRWKLDLFGKVKGHFQYFGCKMIDGDSGTQFQSNESLSHHRDEVPSVDISVDESLGKEFVEIADEYD